MAFATLPGSQCYGAPKEKGTILNGRYGDIRNVESCTNQCIPLNSINSLVVRGCKCMDKGLCYKRTTYKEAYIPLLETVHIVDFPECSIENQSGSDYHGTHVTIFVSQ